MMGINRDINTKDSGGGMEKFVQSDTGNGYRRKTFLFSERGHRIDG